jgi:hypothetical protein
MAAAATLRAVLLGSVIDIKSFGCIYTVLIELTSHKLFCAAEFLDWQNP